ncbi:MAG: hypothetical protein ACLFSW_00615 [Halobacteriales archaeon]
MNSETVKYLVSGIGAVTVAAGAYNLLTMPEGDDGIFGAVREAQETYDWAVSTSAVNSVVFVLIGVAVVLIAVNADLDG